MRRRCCSGASSVLRTRCDYLLTDDYLTSTITQLIQHHSAVLCLTLIKHTMSTHATHFDAASIARLCLHDPIHFNIQYAQTLHRLALLQHWNVPTASNVLELGCGQGDCTTVLAHAVGEQGRVVAVDPAGLDYALPPSHCATHCGGPAKSSGLMLLQGPRIPSAKHRITSRRVRWVGGSLGFNDLPWTTSPPCPILLPPPRRPLVIASPSTQQCSHTA